VQKQQFVKLILITFFINLLSKTSRERGPLRFQEAASAFDPHSHVGSHPLDWGDPLRELPSRSDGDSQDWRAQVCFSVLVISFTCIFTVCAKFFWLFITKSNDLCIQLLHSNRVKTVTNPKWKEEEEALRKRFTEQVRLEENRFRSWEQQVRSRHRCFYSTRVCPPSVFKIKERLGYSTQLSLLCFKPRMLAYCRERPPQQGLGGRALAHQGSGSRVGVYAGRPFTQAAQVKTGYLAILSRFCPAFFRPIL
jgi:hypothetical protein